jgi:preprotein translocase subunit SecD
MIGVREKDKPKVDAILARKDVQDALKRAGLGGSCFLWAHDLEPVNNIEIRPIYYLKKKAELKGDIIKDARWEVAQGGLEAGQAVVNLEMNREGARRFSRVTGVNVQKFLAIILDSTVYSAPQIRQKISQGRAQITGSFTPDDAKNLSIVLRAGALPAPVTIIEERTVGPSLGQDSIDKAIKACVIGFALIVVFMLIYYKFAGLIANIALLLNLIFILAIMASVGATLTLPGVAGLILIIGISIDANVIIFERIREELAVGKTIRSAVDAGYARAFVTIMDANITTLFTALILMWVGTGPIKGFAVTMIFGILVSLFTALFLTHVIFNIITSNKELKKLSI